MDSIVAKRLVCFGANGVSMFQGYKSGVTQQLKDQDAPFLLGVHCMVYCTNLAVEPLSNILVVLKLGTLCSALCTWVNARNTCTIWLSHVVYASCFGPQQLTCIGHGVEIFTKGFEYASNHVGYLIQFWRIIFQL